MAIRSWETSLQLDAPEPLRAALLDPQLRPDELALLNSAIRCCEPVSIGAVMETVALACFAVDRLDGGSRQRIEGESGLFLLRYDEDRQDIGVRVLAALTRHL